MPAKRQIQTEALKDRFWELTLKGLGQIMLQENAWTGLLLLAGIFFGSALMGLGALVAVICGTATARLFKFDRDYTQMGLYGFSAALVGVALLLFFKPVFLVWVFLVLGSILAATMQHFFIKRNLPVFTLPFVLVTWLCLLFFKYYSPDVLMAPPVVASSEYRYFSFALRGYGQVIFQENLVSGLLFFLAVFLSSPTAALYGLAAAVLAGVLSPLFEIPPDFVGSGLFSFNAVLCAIAFSGTEKKDGAWVLLAVLLSVVISFAMLYYDLPQLTFPFVAASFVTSLMKRIRLPSGRQVLKKARR